MNFRKLIFSDPKKFDLKKLKSLSWVILIFALFQFLFFFIICIDDYYYGDKTVTILVSNISKTKTYKDFTVDGNRFVTGIEGRLHYNTKSFEEALLFTKIGDTTILHSLLFLIIGLILFFSIQRINDAKMFSQKMVNILFGLMMLLYVFPLLIHYFERQIVGKMLLKKTGNMFELVMTQDLGTEKFLILSVLLMFIYFIKKGTEIQEEQDLTV